MSNDDELLAGIPKQVAKPIRLQLHTTISQPAPNTELANDDGILSDEQAGIPVQKPAKHKRVTIKGQQRGQDAYEDKLIDEPSIGSTASRLLRSPALSAFIIFLATSFLIVVLSEVLQFVEAVRSSPTLLRVIAYSCLLLLGLSLCWAIARLAVAYYRLIASPQVRLDVICDARSRAVTQEQVSRELKAGHETLKAILRTYPIDDVRQSALLESAGLREEDITTLKGHIQDLLKHDGPGWTKWVENCDRFFVSQIDSCAKQKVSDYARRVAIKTALSPTGLMDSLIVAVNAVFMVEEICRLYHVRTDRWHSVLLTGKIVFSTFVSARLEDQIDDAADRLFDGVISSIPKMSEEMLATVTLGALKRTVEGGINMALFFRLGASTITMLRPIRVK